ncbi:MAG TPA: protein translocase subunit SecD [Xanthobacteraceae bacterium]|jgi:preprotein translocase subunit SecD
MLYFTRWRSTAILLATFVLCLFVVPDFIPRHIERDWPAWAQHRLVLGLDLQGGSHLLFEVDSEAVRNDVVEALAEDVRRILNNSHIQYSGLATQNGAVEVQISDASGRQAALAKLAALARPLPGLFGVAGQRANEITELGGGRIRIEPTDAAVNRRVQQAVQQSIEIIERRINALGVVEPTVESEGADRILVEVPGLQDPNRLKELVGKTAKLTFQLVDLSESPEQAIKMHPPPEAEILYDSQQRPPVPYLVEKRVAVPGSDLIDAVPAFDPRTGEPIVSFRLNTAGAERFAKVTRDNVGRPFAIVLDNQVISAPVIREPIVGGSGEITGHFTVQQANDLAILLRSGALPAPLTAVEERTIGPGLGQDSINAGEIAAMLAAGMVILFMLASYGLFGLYADLAVAINVVMIFGILTLLDATLTLPGIAGIVLTMGIAVDSNVLIYERIREEVQHGRSPVSAIDAGFRRALATIVDSNITTFIASAVLFFIGTGPVRGFAVTLGVGILTTLFTAFTLTRLMISWWVEAARPQALAIR